MTYMTVAAASTRAEEEQAAQFMRDALAQRSPAYVTWLQLRERGCAI